MLKRTKIVATIGPATSSREKIKKLIESGMNVARINFSHGDFKSNGQLIRNIREAGGKMGVPVGIMADLQGPRIRTVIEKDIAMEKGDLIAVYDVSVEKPKIKKFIGLDWKGIIKNIEVGNYILIEDGLIKFKVVKKNKNYLLARVENGGTVKNRKGVNIPDAKLKIGAVTQKDEKDLNFALKLNVDFVALSFVSNVKEILAVKKKIKKILGRSENLPQIVAKIERKEAIKNIDALINASDIIMVARGDLGIELEESKVVIYQKEIIEKCLHAGRPVIVATQMLNSMIESARPTRAEVSDVSNAVIDHADAVMLSGETANGKYPIEAVRIMTSIISRTEESPFDDLEHGFLGDYTSSISSAVANSAHELAKDSGAKAIVVASMTGFTARMMGRHRPDQFIYVVTNSQKTHDQLTILWGTDGFILPDCKTLDELIVKAVRILVKNKKLKKGDKVIIVTGRPHMAREHMSLVKVEEVK